MPVSNLFTLNATVAEHWLYIPSIGILMFLTGCWLDLTRPTAKVIGVLSLVFLIGLTYRCNRRAADWKDPVTFYLATIRNGGDSIRVRINLAGEFQKRGRLAEAERIYRSTLRALPNFALAQNLLAQNLLLQGKISGGERNLSKIDFDPNKWESVKVQAAIYESRNERDSALKVVQDFSATNWWHAESLKQLGELFVANGDSTNAVNSYLRASNLDVRDAESLDQAAVLLAQAGHFFQAIQLAEKAVQRESSPRQLEILNSIRQLASTKTQDTK